MRGVVANSAVPLGAGVDVPAPVRQGGSFPSSTGEHHDRAAGGGVHHPENAHDAGEESSYHASPVYDTDLPDVGRLTTAWGQQ